MQETPVNGSSVWSPLVCAHGHAYCLVEDPDGVVQIFDNGQWTTTPQQFQPVSCASDTFCIVYTSTGYAVWNGSIVGPGSDPFGNFRPRISCPTDSFCLAVAGSSRDVLQWTYDGITWSAGQGTGLTGYTTEPSCLSATSCWLLTYDYAGGLSRGAQFDGQNWTSARVQSRRFQTSLSCWSADGCRSVDRGADISTLKRGHWHTAQPIPRSGHPNDVSCGSASMCMAVDETGHALRFDGHKWQQPVPIDIHRRLRSVSCPTASFCMAVDDHGYAVRYSGGVWHRPRLALSVSYSYQTIDISCGSPAFCGVVVQDGRAAVYRNDSWHNTPRVLEEHGNSLNAISCTSSRRCVAVGAGMSVYDGRWRHPLASTHYFDDVSCVARTCAAPSRQVWMRNDGVLARSGVPGYGRTICATRHFCLMSASHSRHAVATNGASWADAQVPTGSFVTGDCTKRMCMLLVNAGGVHRQWEETHASA